MLDHLKIISGPKYKTELPSMSLGKYLYDVLRKGNTEDVLAIDGETNETLTVSHVLRDSRKLTTILKRYSIQQNDVIAIISENSINYTVPVLAAFYMGVIVNPLNPAYTKDEIKHALNISKAKLIFCSKSCISTILEVKRCLDFIETIIVLNGDCNSYINCKNLKSLLDDTKENQYYEPENFDPVEQVALICLSSGTTGLPKGVITTHNNLLYCIRQFMEPQCGNVTSKDTTVSVLPQFHIYGLSINLISIATSMKYVLLTKFNPDTFLKVISIYKANKLFLVAPLLTFLATTTLADAYDISSLKNVIWGSASLPDESVREFKTKFPKVILQQAYGLTETTAGCLLQPLENNKPKALGVLAPGIKAKVCDTETREILGPFQTGEFCFKGPIVTKGYYKNEACTKESIDEDGFYHTGDIGYYDNDNYFYLKGRIKEIIRYKCFQVSPLELENLLLTHPAIKDCAVVGKQNERVGEMPLAFVVINENFNITEDDVINFVAEQISVQKHLTGGVKFINEIPKSAAGKILRNNLKNMIDQ